jgi:hypothetical protein
VFRLARIHEAVSVLAALTTLTLLAFYQQSLDLFAVPDRGDPLFSIWRMAWVRHQLAIHPRHLFDANIFYPLPATLTYSDSMILPALASAPLAWMQVHPVVAYNIMLLSAFILSGAAAYTLARELGSGPLGSWIAAAVFTLAPFRVIHFSHFELQMTMWMPIVLLCVHRLIISGRGGYTGLLGLALAAQWYSSMYYGLFLTLYAVAFAAVLIASRRIADRRLWYVATAIGLALVLVVPLLFMYARTTGARGERPRETVAAFSAVPADYLRSASRNPIYRRLLPRPVHAERALFPGATSIVLAAVGAWPPFTAPRLALMAAGALAFDGSMGLNGVVYPLVYRLFPPLHSVRVPARFAMLVVLTLAMLGARGAARALSAMPSLAARVALTVCLTLAIVADAWPHSDRLPVWRTPPAIYAALPAHGAVLFEFPVHQPADRFSENLPYMYFSIWHWRPMVNGYSGFIPASYDALLAGVANFPDAAALRFLRTAGVTHVAVNCRLWESNVCLSTMMRLEMATGVRRVARADWYGAQSGLYELDPVSSMPDAASGRWAAR